MKGGDEMKRACAACAHLTGVNFVCSYALRLHSDKISGLSVYYIGVCVSDNISFEMSNNLRFGVVYAICVTDSHLGPFIRVYFILTHIMPYNKIQHNYSFCVCVVVYIVQDHAIFLYTKFNVVSHWSRRGGVGDAAAPHQPHVRSMFATTVLLLFVYMTATSLS